MREAVNIIVIPVAGAGTGLLPITNFTPKEILRLVDKPIFYYLLKEAYIAGIRRAIFIIHTDKKNIKNFLKGKESRSILKEFPKLRLEFIETKHRQGDGQALYEARNILKRKKAFAVTMGDLISFPGESIINELKKVYSQKRSPIISIERIERSKSKQYGMIDPKKSNGRIHQVGSIVEKPEPKEAPSEYAMTGKYILTPKIFNYLGRLLKERKPNEEVKLASALHDYAREHKLYAYVCKNKHFDTGNKADLVKTELIFALHHPELGHQIRPVLSSLIKNQKRNGFHLS